jgi:hypothetical protein
LKFIVQLKGCNWKTLGSDLVFSECGMSDRLIEVAGEVALCFVGNVSVWFNLIKVHTFLSTEVNDNVLCL